MHASDNDFPLQSQYNYPSSAGPAIDIADILGTLRRKWLFPLFGCLIGLALAVSYIVFVQLPYKSSARILLDRTVNRYLQTNKIIDEPTFDDSEIASQVYILSSESIVVQVVRSMNLTRDAEFVGSPNAGGALSFNKLIHIIKHTIGGNDDIKINSDALLERTAVENFLKRLSIYREDVANVINVTFASEDANKAADIANAVADTYLAANSEAKFKSTKMVSQLLQDRLMELKVQAIDADRALQNYKIANNLVNTGKGLLNSEQLSNLSTQLTNARIAMTEAKARLDRIQQATSEEGMLSATVPDAINSGVIVSLRSQYRDLAARVTDIESRVGPEHMAVVKLRERMDALGRAIRDEEQRIANSYATEYQIAKARSSELAATVAELVGEAGTSSQAQVTMRELESSAEALRNLYNNFLQKFQEINTVQTQTIPVRDARIITRAAPPLHKSSKKSMFVLAGSIIFGFLLGAGAAFGGEWAAGVFRSPNQVKQVTDIDCVILPTVEANRGRPAFSSAKSMLVEEFVLDAPYSRFTEALRNVKTLINTAQLVDGVKVIGVVSSVAEEGKTTIAANLATLMMTNSGARTLIIDGDLHRRLLTAKLAPDAREGLIEALRDSSRLAALVSKRQRSGVDVLPCVHLTRVPNAAELLGSPQMEQLLVAARKAYDCVVIEIPPIMSVVDVKMIERFIDRFIFVVEWGQTKRRLVLEALSEAEIIRERLIGIVLNKADPLALRSIEAYKGKKFRDYYEG
jgi:succinoglycan biosynthesis transport protein ExoP